MPKSLYTYILFVALQQRENFLFGRNPIAAVGDHENAVLVAAEKCIEGSVNASFIRPYARRAFQTPVLGAVINLLRPFIIESQPF